MIVETRINFSNIRDLVNAAESLKAAGEDDKASDVLRTLAKRIIDEVR